LVTVLDLDDASFLYAGATFCAPSSGTPVRTVPGNGNYTISPATNLAITASTGFIDVITGTNVGPYVVTLTSADACPNTYTLGITVTANPVATFRYAGPFCRNDPNATIIQLAGASPGNFTATPTGLVFISTTTGEVDLTNSLPNTYNVTNTIPRGNGCNPASAVSPIVIEAIPITTVSSTTVCVGQSGTITAGGATSYTWSGGFPAGPTLTANGVYPYTSYTVTGTTSGCSSTNVGTIFADIIPVTTVSNASICANGITTVTASGATTYLWNVRGIRVL